MEYIGSVGNSPDLYLKAVTSTVLTSSFFYFLVSLAKAENTAVGIRHSDQVAPSILKCWH
jgi:hypothetical protein